jgi:hypothetical protein
LLYEFALLSTISTCVTSYTKITSTKVLALSRRIARRLACGGALAEATNTRTKVLALPRILVLKYLNLPRRIARRLACGGALAEATNTSTKVLEFTSSNSSTVSLRRSSRGSDEY